VSVVAWGWGCAQLVQSVGGECVGGRGSVVTGWGKMKGKVKMGKEWMRRGGRSSWEGE
jgi:hypothetical protein